MLQDSILVSVNAGRPHWRCILMATNLPRSTSPTDLFFCWPRHRATPIWGIAVCSQAYLRSSLELSFDRIRTRHDPLNETEWHLFRDHYAFEKCSFMRT